MSNPTTPPEKKITIVGIDDYSYFAAQLRDILEANPAYNLVAQFKTGNEALEKCPLIQPDVIMIGSLPDMGNVALLKKLMTVCPLSQIVMSSVSDVADWLLEVFNAGGRFILSLPYDKERVYTTIDAIMKLKKSI